MYSLIPEQKYGLILLCGSPCSVKYETSKRRLTGCSIIKRIMFALITQARNKLTLWGMCQINPEFGPF